MSGTDESSSDDSSDDEIGDFVTLGKLSAFKTAIKWRFPDGTHCPSCGISCSSRQVALAHFRLLHADTLMVCIHCDILFDDAAKLLYHHARQHANHLPPKLKESGNNTKVESKATQRQESDESEDEEDDLIILNGCGRITQWRFPPSLKHCPVHRCGVEFGVRSDAIRHYRKRHAKRAILCPICDKPISCSNRSSRSFKRHYKGVHPNEKLPYDFSATTMTGSKVGKNNDGKDDLITLHGCGRTTKWLFPQYQKKCPVHTCREEFNVRSDAIEHYKEKHANTSILCPICVKPICTQRLWTFKDHYERIHSGEKLPYNLVMKTESKLNNTKDVVSKDESLSSESERDEDDKENDLITLRGCGKVTYWRFPPKLTHCPIKTCLIEFGVRSDAIRHYKNHHAHYAILCPVCVKPIACANGGFFGIKKHYKKVHPNQALPYDFNAKTKSKKSMENFRQSSEIGKDDNEADGVITLHGCGRTTYWTFPQKQKQCPVHICREDFGNRSEAIEHYKERHTNFSILCPICSKPIIAQSLIDFAKHYKRIHPNEKLPYNLSLKTRSKIHKIKDNEDATSSSESESDNGEENDLITLRGCGRTTHWRFPKNLTQCPAFGCNIKFDVRLDAINHYKKHHATHSILCPICDKPVLCTTGSLGPFNGHYQKAHPSEESPYGFGAATISQDDSDLIILNGCGRTTYWRFPPYLRQCPFHSCRKEFDARSDVIEHYKEQHAKNAILCPKCNKPICGRGTDNFKTHYAKVHPNHQVPYNMDTTSDTKVMENASKDGSLRPGSEKEKDDDEEDDLITLRGCGRTTHWRFPENSKHCPVQNCRIEFGVRTQAIDHFKECHANHSILCPICDKPIVCTNGSISIISNHFKRVHPNEVSPYDFSAANTSQNGIDLITLNGCGLTTYWQFPPYLMQCPVHSCRKEFGTRLGAIEHYKTHHASNSILCPICVKPICTQTRWNLKKHYMKMHPNQKVPYNMDTTSDTKAIENASKDKSSSSGSEEDDDDLIALRGCGRLTHWRFPKDLKLCPVQTCRVEFGVRADAINHYNKRHASYSILCPKCVKPIICHKGCSTDFRKHYASVHKTEELPYGLSLKTKSQAEENYRQEKSADTETKKNDDEVDDLIILYGCGQKTQWRFPEHQKLCPVHGCNDEFSVRSDAIKHYKKYHASYSIFCPLCVKPICAQRPYELRNHYKRLHPNHQMPYNLKSKSKSKSKDKMDLKDDDDDEMEWRNDDEVDDLIILNGLGETTFWHFPKHINHCPVMGCGLVFPNRVGAIEHYKEKHADHFIACSICAKPLASQKSGTILSHYQNVHPDAELPPYVRPKQPAKQVPQIKMKIISSSKDGSEKTDDLITLNGCGIETKWRFPDGLNYCPIKTCNLVFPTRNEAIAHYKEQHASPSILCTLCDKPINVPKKRAFLSHYGRVHPNKKVPFDLGEPIEKTIKPCIICGKLINTKNIQRHIADMHSSDTFVCPLKGCEFESKRLESVRLHWNKLHSSLKFPEVRRESNFTFKSSTPGNIKQKAAETSTTTIEEAIPNASVQENTPDIPDTPKSPPQQEHIESDGSLLVRLRTASEPSDSLTSDEEMNFNGPDFNFVPKTEFGLKMHRDTTQNTLKKRKRKRMVSRPSHYTSTTDAEDETMQRPVKRRRLVKKRARDSCNRGSRNGTPTEQSHDTEKLSEELVSGDTSPDYVDTCGGDGSLALMGSMVQMIFDQASSDPLIIDIPMDLSMPINVLDSEDETAQVESKHSVKCEPSSENISN